MKNYPKYIGNLAEGLQHSNHKEVSELAKAYLALKANHDELKHAYVLACSEKIMSKYEKIFEKLAEWEKNNETE